MPIIVRGVAPRTIDQPTQPRDIQTGAPIAKALDIVGRTTSELGRIGAQAQQIDKGREVKLAKLREEEQEKSDRADATDAVTLSKGAINEQSIKFKARKGRTAKGVTSDYDAFTTELFNKTLDGLPNDNVKQMYTEDVLAVNINFRNSMIQHASDENAVVNVSAAESSILNSVQSSTINFENPLSYSIERANIEDQIDILSGLQGWDKETKQRNLTDSMAKLEEGRIRQWSATDAKVAKELFEINKDAFNLDKQEELSKLLDKDDTLQFAQQTIDGLEATEPDRTKWDEIIKTMKYPGTPEEQAKKREAVEKRGKSRKDKLDADAKADKKSLLNNALNEIIREPDKTKREDMALALEDFPDTEKALSVSDAVERRKTGDVETNIPTYAQLLDDINAGKYKSVNEITPFFADLSTAHYNTAVSTLQSRLNSNSKETKVNNVNYSTAKAAYENVFKKKYDVEDDADNFIVFQEILDTEVAEKGRDLSFTEYVKIARRLTVEGTIIDPKAFWEEDLTFPEAFIEGKVDKFLPEISDEHDDREIKDIKAAFKANGIILGNTAKDQMLMRLYKKSQKTEMNLPLSDREVNIYKGLLEEKRGLR